MPRVLRCLGVLLLLLGPTPAAAGPILLNGSFEIGPPPFDNEDIDIPAGSTDILGWTILGGGVDLLEEPWDVSDGLRAIDLDLRSPGGIEQTFATMAGLTYGLTFDLSGNPHGGSLLKHLLVSVGDTSLEYLFDSTGQARDQLLWQTITLSFLALNDSTTLRFESLSAADSSYGALIDNVSVTPVPEPSTLLLIGAGAVLLKVRRRVRLK
jgi:choice-of-anchor C domain-containing protein